MRFIYIVCTALLLYSCGSLALQTNELTPPHHLAVTEIEDNLDIKVIFVEEISKETNSIKVDYEIRNNSSVIFDPYRRDYSIYFSVITQDGREVGHYEDIYRNIAPYSSVILTETINLSIYKYKSIASKLFIE